jgi:hypothetical protein
MSSEPNSGCLGADDPHCEEYETLIVGDGQLEVTMVPEVFRTIA